MMTKNEIREEIKALKLKIIALESQLKEPEYIDLGLPSGTLWADCNEEGDYDFDTAVETFGDNLPKLWQLCELWESCIRKGNTFIGPNGNSINVPGGEYWSSTTKDSDDVFNLYSDGSNMYININNHSYICSIRLCKRRNSYETNLERKIENKN